MVSGLSFDLEFLLNSSIRTPYGVGCMNYVLNSELRSSRKSAEDLSFLGNYLVLGEGGVSAVVSTVVSGFIEFWWLK